MESGVFVNPALPSVWEDAEKGFQEGLLFAAVSITQRLGTLILVSDGVGC